MKKLFCIAIATLCLYSFGSAQTAKPVSTYTAFLATGNPSAKDYILSLFDKHDVVIICERTHTEETQYDLLDAIITDQRFINNVRNVFVEIGTSKLNPDMNRFLHTRNLSDDEITRRIIGFQRNASMWPIWAASNYFKFYQAVYKLNDSLPDDERINIYPSDIPFIWTDADSSNISALKPMLADRDSIIASQIIRTLDSIKGGSKTKTKALIVMNYRHAFNQAFPMPQGSMLRNVSWYLFNRYGDRAANVLLNTVVYGGNAQIGLIQNGKWDAAVSMAGKESVGFDFKGSPFGSDSLDLWPLRSPFTYEQVFTGFAFYLPVEKHLLAEGLPGLVDAPFKKELLRRVHLISTVGGEFRQKMVDFEKAIQAADTSFLNQEDKKGYYQLDALLATRNTWLK